jgi:glycosyltransferase involved in cell wall biosynthesis
MKLSLIIPVYKVEQYIEKCLQSIVMQLPQDDVEIIIVDDGSPDQSIQIANQFLNQQSETIKNKFKIISQENKGLSSARNTGILCAKGEYLAFLDSDDYLNHEYFTSLLDVIKKHKPDIIEFKAQRVDNYGKTELFLKPIGLKGFYDLGEVVWLRISNQSAWFAWLRIYKADLFENIKYPERVNFEDAYTTPYLYLKAKNIYFLDRTLIFYRINPASITATKSLKNIEDLGGAIPKMLSSLKYNPILSASTIALSQNYITDSLNTEGVLKAYQRWYTLRKIIVKNVNFDKKYLKNRGNKLFLNFGIAFLLLCKILKK